MSSLIKYGSIWHFQYYDHGVKHSKSLRTQDHQKAKILQKIMDGRLASGERGKTYGKLEISVEIERFLEYKSTTVKPGTLKTYRNSLKTLLGALGDEKITMVEQLTPEVISRALGRLKTEMGLQAPGIPYMIWKFWAKWLFDQEKIKVLISKNWPKIKIIYKDPAKLESYTAEEIRKMRIVAAGKDFEPVFLFGLLTGCRALELQLLLVQHVNFENGVISARNVKIEGKMQPFRPIPIHPDLLPFLEKLCAGKGPNDPVFTGLSVPNLGRSLSYICREAGVTYRRFHGLRHTFVSHLLRSGVDVFSVMRVAGHKSIQTTQRYLHQVAGLADVSRLKF